MSDEDYIEDSGRFDLQPGELYAISLALITSAGISPQVGKKFLDDTFKDLVEEDYPSALRAMGRVAAQLADVINVLRTVPAFRPLLDKFIADLAAKSTSTGPA